jgi:NAD(P)-dependent dehydrogenase (short-subunit alcohol dehydrogenase family)
MIGQKRRQFHRPDPLRLAFATRRRYPSRKQEREVMAIAGKTVLITGATDGLGKLVATKLAKDGAMVLLHGRDPVKGDAVLAEVRAATGSTELEYYNADLASLADVRALAAAVTAKHRHLDVLVNNAGIALGGPRQLSHDGQELHFQVNYVAPFLLTELLLPIIKAAAPSRIVNVSSLGQAPIDFDDPMIEHGYETMRAYCQSKLAQIGFTIDLAAKLTGSGVTVTALHPGTYMNTNMVIKSGIKPLTPVEEGVEATVRLIASDAVEGETGVFYNQQAQARAHDQAYDAAARKRLWDLSETLAGLA